MLENVLVPKHIAQERYNICKSCDRFNNVTFQCKECLCFMKLKVKIPSASCPIEKWSKEISSSEQKE